MTTTILPAPMTALDLIAVAKALVMDEGMALAFQERMRDSDCRLVEQLASQAVTNDDLSKTYSI